MQLQVPSPEAGNSRSSGSRPSSGLHSLTNTRSVRMSNLPAFLRYKEKSARAVLEFGAQSNAFRPSVPSLGSLGAKSLPRMSPGKLRGTTESSKRESVFPDKASLKDEAERLLQSISDPHSDPNEALFTTDKERFTRAELGHLVSWESVIPRKVFQAYLSYLQKLHKRRYARGKSIHRLKVIKLDISYAIFNLGRAQTIHTAENIFTLDFLLFPVFVGYWSLLVVNMKEREVSYWDPLKKYLYVETLLVCLLQFLGAELLLHESRALEQSEWKDIAYKGVGETQVCPRALSQLYVLRHAEDYVKGWPQELHPEELNHYRERVFMKLVVDWTSHSP